MKNFVIKLVLYTKKSIKKLKSTDFTSVIPSLGEAEADGSL